MSDFEEFDMMAEINSFSMESQITKLKTNRICLLDADYIKYIVCSRRKKEIDFEKENYAENGATIFHTQEPIIRLLEEWLTENIFMKIDDPIIYCFSGKSYNTFRYYLAIDKEYKGKRDYEESYLGERDDTLRIIKYIKEKYITLLFDDLEADDIVSVLQDPDKTYIMSKDKDCKQVPGWHYNFASNEIYEITPPQALYNLAYQLLAGDSVDNIGGFPQMGEKKATQFLKEILDPKYYILRVLKHYQKKFGIFKGTDMFNETWALVKMRENRGEYFKHKYQKMFDTKEYILRNVLK